MEIVKVTPDMASKWLKKNSNNRTVSKWVVQNYARQMRENKWQLNGEAIMFDTKGNLMNGQHRLLAVIEADATVPMAVGRGFPESVKDTFDQHRKRTAADVLMMHGIHSGNTVAAVVRLLDRWDKGIRNATLMGAGQYNLTSAEVLDYIKQDDMVLPAVEAYYNSKPAELGVSARVWSSLWVLTHRIDPAVADDFFLKLETGEMLPKGHPILALRRYWANVNAGYAGRGGRKFNVSMSCFHAGVRAWNAFAEGEEMMKVGMKSNTVPELSVPKEG